MVGDSGGAKLFRQIFLSLSSNTFTSMNEWKVMSFAELKLWSEAMRKDEGDEE